jgi:hypothetical protein
MWRKDVPSGVLERIGFTPEASALVSFADPGHCRLVLTPQQHPPDRRTDV